MRKLEKLLPFGVRKRVIPKCNYEAIWYCGQTIRTGSKDISELPYENKEFYDISLGKRCNLSCQQCYCNATKDGELYENICETFQKWMDLFPADKEEKGYTLTSKPFALAIGSTCEPLEHPDFSRLLNIMFHNKIAPAYTTNGIKLVDHPESDEILEATRRYVAGVALSVSSPINLNMKQRIIQALLSKGGTCINLHHILSDNTSVETIKWWIQEYDSDIDYHVILPLVPIGRSTKAMDPKAWKELENWLISNDIKNVAFGAKLYDLLQYSKINTWLYEPESLSANLLLKKDNLVFTKSSFDLNPVKEIKF